jgi:hypothetical protein
MYSTTLLSSAHQGKQLPCGHYKAIVATQDLVVKKFTISAGLGLMSGRRVFFVREWRLTEGKPIDSNGIALGD